MGPWCCIKNGFLQITYLRGYLCQEGWEDREPVLSPDPCATQASLGSSGLVRDLGLMQLSHWRDWLWGHPFYFSVWIDCLSLISVCVFHEISWCILTVFSCCTARWVDGWFRVSGLSHFGADFWMPMFPWRPQGEDAFLPSPFPEKDQESRLLLGCRLSVLGHQKCPLVHPRWVPWNSMSKPLREAFRSDFRRGQPQESSLPWQPGNTAVTKRAGFWWSERIVFGGDTAGGRLRVCGLKRHLKNVLGFQHFFQQAVCILMLPASNWSPFPERPEPVKLLTSGVWEAVISGSFLESIEVYE